jgi:hypothetical protein
MNLDIHEKANNLVRTEIYVNLSGLVEAMAAKGDEEAQELTYGVLDYETAAEEAGWTLASDRWTHDDEENEYCNAEDLCAEHDIEAHGREVFEHWSVSSWLASELEKRGEKVARDWYGHNVWARTTTGQAISIDGVIENIVRAMARG